MKKLKDLDSKIVFLQETHILKEDNIKISRRWQGSIYTASFTSQSRGVMTLIHNSVPFQVFNVSRDTFGRFLIIQGSLLSVNLTLVNICGPNTDEPNFFTNLFLTRASLPGEYIIAGDWNCTLDPVYDRSTGADQTHNRSRTTIHHFIKELNLLDIWRHVNPSNIAYSCHSSTFQAYSCIDYFLISATLMSKVKDCYYDSILISDHGPCCMTYVDKNFVKGPPRWNLNQKWLKDEEFVEYVGNDYHFRVNTTQTTAGIKWVIHYDPTEINKEFRKYYENLYKSHVEYDPTPKTHSWPN